MSEGLNWDINEALKGYKLANEMTGLIILQTTQIEGLVNQIIASYFCRDEKKIEDCIAFIQETSFPHRLEYLKVIHKEVNTDFVSKLNFSKIKFEYLKKGGNPIMSLYDALEQLKTLRNLFAHSTVTPTDNQKDLSLQLTKYKPRNKRQEKQESPIKFVINNFTSTEAESLINDMGTISTLLYDLFFKLNDTEFN